EVTVTSEATDNYLAASKEVSLVIENAEITGLAFEGATFTYDGTAHSIAVSGLPEGATVAYADNGQINAGSYIVTATVSQPGYADQVLTANLLINKAAQNITFDEIADRSLQGDDFQLMATSTSGLPVIYTYTYETENPAATVGPRGFVRLLQAGQIAITAVQEGNNNYEAAAPVTMLLTVRNSEGRLDTVVINGTTYTNPSAEIYYLIGCSGEENEVEIQLEPNPGSSVDQQEIFTIATPAPGFYYQTVTVTPEDGSITRSYNITIEKNFNFEDIVVQKFNNVLLVNNNPETNGGYKFVSYKWFKNGLLVGTDQYFSEGDNASDQLNSESTYSVEMTTEDGEVLRTCSTSIQLRSSYKVVLTPNPVNAGESLELFADYPKQELETMELAIHTLNGGLVKRLSSNRKITTIDLPVNMQAGVYILSIRTSKRNNSVKFIVR
ncbi:T9SS type A sorting domain-containing protein, partial [Autumnicola psychrophila]